MIHYDPWAMGKDMKFEFKPDSTQPLHLQMERHFQDLILGGELKEGERLPPLAELAKSLGVNFKTAQKVFSRLKAAGFIRSSPSLGTFVGAQGERPFVALLFGPSLTDESSHFYRALLRAFQAELDRMRDCRWQCRFHDGLIAWKGNPFAGDTSAFQRLRSDMRSKSLQGVIEVDALLKDCLPDIDATAFACVHIGRPRPRESQDVASDAYRFGWDAVELAAKRGLSKIAYLRTCGSSSNFGYSGDLDGINDAVRKWRFPSPLIHDMGHVLESLICGAKGEALAYRETLRLVETWELNGAWPDALMLTDDIIARGVALALVKKGVDVPGRLLVLCVANEGIEHHYGIPVKRHLFPTGTMAREALGLLKARVRGERQPRVPILVPGRGWLDDDIENTI